MVSDHRPSIARVWLMTPFLFLYRAHLSLRHALYPLDHRDLLAVACLPCLRAGPAGPAVALSQCLRSRRVPAST